MKIFLSAGEASGDVHGAPLIAALRRGGVEEFTFLGGDAMAAAAGHEPLIHYRHMAYMGYVDVIRHAPQVLANLRTAREAISGERPDAVVLIDYPSFNLRLAAHAHSLGIPVYYYIAPKVWAWKEWRIGKLKRYCTRVLSILPFEVPYFTRKGLEVTYVGNPTMEELTNRPAAERLSAAEVCARAGLPAEVPYIALVPGSRRSEISANLPVMLAAARRHPEYRIIVTGAPGIEPEFYSAIIGADPVPVVEGITHAVVERAAAALVTSGTATLETAILGTPQVVCYRSSGSKLVYNIMSRVLKCPYVSLPNLIADREVVPEMLMHHCNATEVAGRLADILPGAPGRRAMLDGYADIHRALAASASAAASAAQAILAK